MAEPFDPAQILPSLEAIASHIISRTDDGVGNKLGTFTPETWPPAEAALLHAQRAARYVALELGSPATTWQGDLEATATDLAALRAALTIEQSYYADGSEHSDSGVDQLGRMFREELAAIQATARNNQIGGARWGSIRQEIRR